MRLKADGTLLNAACAFHYEYCDKLHRTSEVTPVIVKLAQGYLKQVLQQMVDESTYPAEHINAGTISTIGCADRVVTTLEQLKCKLESEASDER